MGLVLLFRGSRPQSPHMPCHIIGRINSPLNLANMKIKKLKFVRNPDTAPDNQTQRILNFMRNP